MTVTSNILIVMLGCFDSAHSITHEKSLPNWGNENGNFAHFQPKSEDSYFSTEFRFPTVF